MGLEFLAEYDKEGKSATRFDCNEKTWRKWTWIYSEALTKIMPRYVSSHLSFDFLFYTTV